MSRPKKYEIDYAEYAVRYGVLKPTIRKWLDDGVDIDNEDEVNLRLKPEKSTATSKELRERKLLADTIEKEWKAKTAELKFLTEKGELIEVGDANDAARRYAACVKAGLNQLLGELPPALIGLSEADIQRILSDKFDNALKQIADSDL
jgi:hypothetical protein